MIRKLFSAIFLFFSLSVSAQDSASFDGHSWRAPYFLAAPEGWGIERFLLPVGFAPEIKFKGVEDIRFAPGWAKKGAEDYWSNLFLWYLDGDVKPDAEHIGQYLKDYYTGLIRVNGADIPREKIIPVEVSVEGVNALATDQHSFQGKVTMLDYMQQQKITLYFTVHVLACQPSGKTFIVHQLSPQPYQHGIWKRMDAIREQFVCELK